MIAVAYGVKQHIIFYAVFLLHLLRGPQSAQGPGDPLLVLPIHQPAGKMAAALLQIKIIEGSHPALFLSQRFDHCLFGVINEQNDMGQLNSRALAHLDPGRDPLQNGSLRRPDTALAAGEEIILLQIHHADEALADLAISLGPLHIEKGMGIGFKYALFQILLHGGIDLGNVFSHLGSVQFCLRQNQTQCRGGVPHRTLNSLPVFRLGGKLVAGHHGPFGHIRLTGQENIGGIQPRRLELFFHRNSFLYSVFFSNRISSRSQPRSTNGPAMPAGSS